MHDYQNRGAYLMPREDNITLGHVESTLGPHIVTECLQSFPNIVEDIYAIEWLPDSENELICATED